VAYLFIVTAVKIETATLDDICHLLHLKPGKPYMLFSYQRKLSVFALQ